MKTYDVVAKALKAQDSNCFALLAMAICILQEHWPIWGYHSLMRGMNIVQCRWQWPMRA